MEWDPKRAPHGSFLVVRWVRHSILIFVWNCKKEKKGKKRNITLEGQSRQEKKGPQYFKAHKKPQALNKRILFFFFFFWPSLNWIQVNLF